MTNDSKLMSLLIMATSLFCGMSIYPQKASDTKLRSENGEILSLSGQRKISGIYPHLTTYAHGRLAGNYDYGLECGIGALAEWNGKLYMINYGAHQPKGSEHKLYIVDDQLNMEIFEGSIGGTPAARMVHQESNQLFLGPYVIDNTGAIRVIPYSRMDGRLNAYARHLKDPKNMVYMYDMEGKLYEVNVNSLEVNKLFYDPLPGWHGKGAYTSQGRLVVSNNGERPKKSQRIHNKDGREYENYQWSDDWKIARDGIFGPDKFGILAEFDGDTFKVIERSQFTDVTTKNGVYAVPNDQSPLWAIGWDKKSLRLKMLDYGKWHTFLLPKAAYNNDPPHGWFTEWPRIRAVTDTKMMMDMHGMFFDFPGTFSASNTAGIRPMGSHLRYISDFLNWNGQVVLATDETSIQGNTLAGQPQSNLWFGNYNQLSEWGPATGYAAIWNDEEVSAGTPSPPLLISGFDRRIAHFMNSGEKETIVTIQIDKNGENDWKDHKTITIAPGEYQNYIFNADVKGEWLRLHLDNTTKMIAAFHFTDSNLKDSSKGEELFSGLAAVDYGGGVSHSKLFSNRANFNLRVYTGEIGDNGFIPKKNFDFTKFYFDFKLLSAVEHAPEALKKKVLWAEDPASVIVQAKEYRLRLPKGHKNYSERFPSIATRSIREVESERELTNICGTFYEVPLYKVGQEPLYKLMRPVATHNKQITDFNTWNGLLVLSGVRKDAMPSEHVYKTRDGQEGIWLGGIDDIWSFGKPVGEGGPWKDTMVKANEKSDMYLMTGYDKKKVRLKSDKNVSVEMLLYVNHYLTEPIHYKTFRLKAGEEVVYEFPEGFSAHWVQLRTDADCTATAWFTYE